MAIAQQVTFPPTGAGLIAFIDHAMQRGLVRPNLGANYKTTCLEVLPLVLGPAWESQDVLLYDVDDLLEEFQAGRGRRLPAAGLERYAGRLAEMLELFRPYAEDAEPAAESEPIAADSNQRGVRERDDDEVDDELQLGHSPNGDGTPEHQQLVSELVPSSPASNGSTPPPPTPPTALPLPPQVEVERLTYPFPLRAGVIITVCLPVDLSTAESVRLARFIDSLAVDSVTTSPARANGQGPSTPRVASARPRSRPTSTKALAKAARSSPKR